MRIKLLIPIFFLALVQSLLHAQFTPNPGGAYKFSGGLWVPATSTTAGGTPGFTPTPIGLYCYNGTNWVPADSTCFGGGGGGFPPAAPNFSVQISNAGQTAFASDPNITINTTTHILSSQISLNNQFLKNTSTFYDVIADGGAQGAGNTANCSWATATYTGCHDDSAVLASIFSTVTKYTIFFPKTTSTGGYCDYYSSTALNIPRYTNIQGVYGAAFDFISGAQNTTICFPTQIGGMSGGGQNKISQIHIAGADEWKPATLSTYVLSIRDGGTGANADGLVIGSSSHIEDVTVTGFARDCISANSAVSAGNSSDAINMVNVFAAYCRGYGIIHAGTDGQVGNVINAEAQFNQLYGIFEANTNSQYGNTYEGGNTAGNHQSTGSSGIATGSYVALSGTISSISCVANTLADAPDVCTVNMTASNTLHVNVRSFNVFDRSANDVVLISGTGTALDGNVFYINSSTTTSFTFNYTTTLTAGAGGTVSYNPGQRVWSLASGSPAYGTWGGGFGVYRGISEYIRPYSELSDVFNEFTSIDDFQSLVENPFPGVKSIHGGANHQAGQGFSLWTVPQTAPSWSTNGSANGALILTATGTSQPAESANQIEVTTPNSVTHYTIQLPGAQPSGSSTFISCTAANPSVCSFAAASGTPFGSTSDVQINNAGAFGGHTGVFTYNLATDTLNAGTGGYTTPGGMVTGVGSSAAGVVGWKNGIAPSACSGANCLNPNSFSIFAPATITQYFAWSAPTAENASAGLLHLGAVASHISAMSVSPVSLTADVSGILPVANGGTGTATPSLVAGTNITITGSWPNQTVNASSSTGVTTATSPLVVNGGGSNVAIATGAAGAAGSNTANRGAGTIPLGTTYLDSRREELTIGSTATPFHIDSLQGWLSVGTGSSGGAHSSTQPQAGNFATTAANNSNAGISLSNDQTSFGENPRITCIINLPGASDITNTIVRCGGYNTTTATTLNVADPAAQFIGFRFVAGTDTNWMCESKDASTGVYTSSGVAVTAGTWYKLVVVVDSTAASADYYIASTVGGLPTRVCSGPLTAHMPAVGQPLNPLVFTISNGTAIENVKVAAVHLVKDF